MPWHVVLGFITGFVGTLLPVTLLLAWTVSDSFSAGVDDITLLAELDAKDLECLESLDRYNKQIWAELLAHRLCKAQLNKDGRENEQ